MTVDTMRKIDRGLGVPLCLLASPLAWLLNVVRRGAIKRNDTSRTLFIELSEMGSAIIADPAMRKLRAEAGAELFFVIFDRNCKSLEILQTVPQDHIFKMRSDSLFTLAAEIVRFFFWCHRRRITMVVDLELFSRFTALLTLVSGAPSRVGFSSLHDEGLFRGSILNKTVRYNPHVHVAINFISLVNKGMGLFQNDYATVAVDPASLRLAQADVPPASVDAVKNKIRNLYPRWNGERIVLLNVNASELLPQRRWSQDNFARTGRELLAAFSDIIIVLTGAKGEREYVAAVAAAIGDERCLNSAGVFSFDELVPLYSISTMMLTNDSGPAHFAAVTPLKVFVLFGPETPALYLPLGGHAEAFYLGLPCSPCVSAANHRKTSCTARPCMTGILPPVVIARLDGFLRGAEQLMTKH